MSRGSYESWNHHGGEGGEEGGGDGRGGDGDGGGVTALTIEVTVEVTATPNARNAPKSAGTGTGSKVKWQGPFGNTVVRFVALICVSFLRVTTCSTLKPTGSDCVE